MVIRSILGSLLRSQVQRAVQERLTGGTDEPTEREQPAEADSGPPPETVGVVFALGIESGGFEDLLRGKRIDKGKRLSFRTGTLDDRRVVVALGGPGRKAAARATEALIDGHDPAWIVSAGFGGGLAPELQAGDFLLADEVVDADGRCFAIDVGLSDEALAANPRLHVGRLLTADSIIARVEDKRALRQQHNALAVDMETHAVAEVCSRREKRFLAVRIISDTADEELPPGIGRMMEQKSTAGKLGATMAHLINRPSNLGTLWNLRERALSQSDRLAKFLKGLIAQL